MKEVKWQGLTTDEVQKKLNQYGKNKLEQETQTPFYIEVFHIITEPMFLLLSAAALIYFLLGEPRDGLVMLVFVLVIVSIEVVQKWKTDQTLKALKDLSAPRIKVIREGQTMEVGSENIVPEDVMLIEEGVKIPADGFVLQANDLRINESSLTGEAEAVWKTIHTSDVLSGKEYWRKDYVYAGTLVTTGSGTILIDKTGSQTEYGKIGSHVAKAESTPSVLDKQIGKLVKFCGLLAFSLLVLVALFTFFKENNLPITNRLTESVLAGITIAMAMIPEEFPVVLAVFLSMGAWRLARKQSLIRKLPVVETMGAVSVLAVDKTGTITENKMQVADVWRSAAANNFDETMGLACEVEPYDPMEMAILDYVKQRNWTKKKLFSAPFLMEYSFTDELKMMGHVWQKQEQIKIAIKGSPESVMKLSVLTESERLQIKKQIEQFAKQGLRVLAVAEQVVSSKTEIPATIEDCTVQFLGLVGLSDPPRVGVAEDIRRCQAAGVKVVMITGDNGVTAQAIARKVGILDTDYYLTGEEIDCYSKAELAHKVKNVGIFARVTPEQKMKIVQAFKQNGEVIAMTGDGVNDAPALKYADVGIAMGKRGSEVSREAADLILLEDDFSTITTTIADGRRIYENIKKAIGYIFVIHIPIALTALAGPLLGIPQAALFLLPIHVVLLELVIDPTCSVVLERQPEEPDSMLKGPRDPEEKLISSPLLHKSIWQGLVIFLCSFGSYYFVLQQDEANGQLARTVGLVILIVANLFLVMVNSSEHLSAVKIAGKLIQDRVIWGILGGTFLILLGLLYSPLHHFFDLAPLNGLQLAGCILIGMLSVLWYEVVKVTHKATSYREEGRIF